MPSCRLHEQQFVFYQVQTLDAKGLRRLVLSLERKVLTDLLSQVLGMTAVIPVHAC